MTEIHVHSNLDLVCPIEITETAYNQLKAAAQSEDDIIRVGVKGGGCSGFLFNLEVINKNNLDKEDDIIYKVKDLTLTIDILSESYLKGTTLDYITSLKESGFKFNNPNVKRTCGCGSSFSV